MVDNVAPMVDNVAPMVDNKDRPTPTSAVPTTAAEPSRKTTIANWKNILRPNRSPTFP